MNVLFDLDGTLTDPRQGVVASLRHALVGLGRSSPSDSDRERYIGPPLHEIFESLLGPADREQIECAVALFRERFSTKGIFENTVYPGIDSALAQLRTLGAVLYVATSKPRIFAERVVEHLEFKGFFRAVYGSEFDGTRSNKADLIAHILDMESLSRSSTFMIGDRAHDVMGARANGIFPIGVLWGYGSRQELISAGAAALCERPTALADVLSSSHGVRLALQASATDAGG